MVVTHDSRVFGFGDQIVHMNDGRIDHVESRSNLPARDSAAH